MAYDAMLGVLRRNPTAKAKTDEEVQDEQQELDIAGSYKEGTRVDPRTESVHLSAIACVLRVLCTCFVFTLLDTIRDNHTSFVGAGYCWLHGNQVCTSNIQ